MDKRRTISRAFRTLLINSRAYFHLIINSDCESLYEFLDWGGFGIYYVLLAINLSDVKFWTSVLKPNLRGL